MCAMKRPEHFQAKWEPVRRRKCDQIRNLVFAAALAAAAFGGAPSQAADLESGARPHARHVRTAWQGWNWRDRCAWEGYYCLYAEYGFVYHYPWDDRPIATEYASRRRHRR